MINAIFRVLCSSALFVIGICGIVTDISMMIRIKKTIDSGNTVDGEIVEYDTGSYRWFWHDMRYARIKFTWNGTEKIMKCYLQLHKEQYPVGTHTKWVYSEANRMLLNAHDHKKYHISIVSYIIYFLFLYFGWRDISHVLPDLLIFFN